MPFLYRRDYLKVTLIKNKLILKMYFAGHLNPEKAYRHTFIFKNIH